MKNLYVHPISLWTTMRMAAMQGRPAMNVIDTVLSSVRMLKAASTFANGHHEQAGFPSLRC
jgi:hypothetical protein